MPNYIIPIIIAFVIVCVFACVWLGKYDSCTVRDISKDEEEESIEAFGNRITIEKSNVRISTRPEEPKPYSDETHFYFKGKNMPTIAKGNYLPLIPIIIDGNQRLRFTTKNGFEGIMKLIDLETAVYYPPVPPSPPVDRHYETLKTKDSTNG